MYQNVSWYLYDSLKVGPHTLRFAQRFVFAVQDFAGKTLPVGRTAHFSVRRRDCRVAAIAEPMSSENQNLHIEVVACGHLLRFLIRFAPHFTESFDHFYSHR